MIRFVVSPVKKYLVFILVSALSAGRLFGLDFTLQVIPSVNLPLGPFLEDSNGTVHIDENTGKPSLFYKMGGGGLLSLDAEFFNFLLVSPQIGYGFRQLRDELTKPVPIANFYDAGLGLGFFWQPFSRLRLQGSGSGGVYGIAGTGDTGGFYNLFWRARASAGFRFSPTFTLSASAAYEDYLFFGDSTYTGLSFGLSATVSLNFGSAKDDVRLGFVQDEAVYPLVSGLYKENQIGTITIVNNEQAEIRNVEVFFQVPGYTNSLKSCGTIPLLNRKKSVEFPMLADFSEAIYNFSENAKMSGEVIISYDMLGAKRRLVKSQTIQVYNRNAVRWTDPNMLAAYVSANSPEVLEYSKFAVGLARARLRTGLNQAMQFGMYLFEGLRLAGFSASPDPATPYAATHLDPNLLDYIQYPFQTLAFVSGDCDDMGLLYAAALQSVGIKAAFLPLGKDFLVAFSMGIPVADADKFFSQDTNYFEIGGEIWIPLSMNALREGFVNSWYAGLDALDAARAGGEELAWVVFGDAWQSYPAVGISGDGGTFKRPPEDVLVRAVENGLVRYISAEFGPKIRAIRDEIAQRGESAALYNQLGVLYVRAGMYTEASAEFLKGSAMGSAASFVNLGNITMLQKNFIMSKEYFTKALELQPDNRSAKSGLDRVLSELDE